MYKAKTTTKKDNEAFNGTWITGDLIHSGNKVYIHPTANTVRVEGEIGRCIIMHEVLPDTVIRLETDVQQTEDVAPTGIIRRVDDLGRVVVPKEIRRQYGIQENTPLELFPMRNGILFKVYRREDGVRSIIKTVKETVEDYADEISNDEYDRILLEVENLCQFVKSKKKEN